jgi:hypothetical protein
MDLDKTYTIDFSEMTFIDGDFLNLSSINESIGSECYIKEDQWIAFEYNNIDICAYYTLEVIGHNEYDKGDYYTPPYSETIIDHFEIKLEKVLIEDTELILNNDIINTFEKSIDKILNI